MTENKIDRLIKDMFLSNLSHEIRSPLNGILGFCQLLQQSSPLTIIQKSHLSSLTKCSLQLMQIMNDLLDYSKLVNNKMPIMEDILLIKDIQDYVKSTLSLKLVEKRQNLIFNIYYLPEYIIIDKYKVFQILINLISNSINYSNVETTINVEIKSIDEGIIEFKVIDKGIGISNENQLKLFNCFTQIDNAKYKNGTGLGLYISKKLSELMGGDITVESEVNKGSIFTVTLKYKHYENIEKIISKDLGILEGKYIIAVDDNANNRMILSELLHSFNMKPIICATALEAFKMIICKKYNFELGLIDICMPDISGYELAKQIKEELPNFKMIALSSIDTFISDINFEHIISKPYNKLQLFNSIHEVILNKNKIKGYIGDEKKYGDTKIDEIECQVIDKKKTKILIADDIQHNVDLLNSLLTNLEYKNIVTVSNGEEAINKLKEENYDILLLDLIMPVMDGFHVINFCKTNNIKTEIIVISASVISDDETKCKNGGVKFFLTKPILLKDLKEIIEHVTKS